MTKIRLRFWQHKVLFGVDDGRASSLLNLREIIVKMTYASISRRTLLLNFQRFLLQENLICYRLRVSLRKNTAKRDIPGDDQIN